MTRATPPIEIEPRKQAVFTHRQKLEILERQSDENAIAHCAECGTPIAKLIGFKDWEGLRQFAFDHERARGLGGKTVTENGRAICDGPGTCHGVKSAQENTDIARCKRLSGEASSQYARRLERKRKGERPLMQSRGFQKPGERRG